MNDHEKFVEELKHSFFKDIMLDNRLINGSQEKNTTDSDLSDLFDSMFDDQE